MLSCYDALLCYDSRTDAFQARYVILADGPSYVNKTLNQPLKLPFEFGCHDHNSCGELKVDMLSISAGTYHMGDGQWRKTSNGTG